MAKETFEQFFTEAGFRTAVIPKEYLSPPTFDLSNTEPIEIISTYEDLPEPVRCAYKHPHKTGAIVKFKCGNIHIIGHECAEKYFGDKWICLQRAHNDREDAALNQRLIMPALEEIERMRTQLQLLRRLAQAKDAFFNTLNTTCPPLMKTLGDVARTGGVWRKTVRGRVWDEDGEYNPQQDRTAVAGEIYGSAAVAIDALSRLVRCLRSLELAEMEFRKNAVTSADIAEGRRQINLALDVSTLLVPEMRAAKTFFSRGALQQLVAVSKKDPEWRKRIGLKAQALKVDTTGYEEFADIPVPVDYPAGFEAIERQLGDLERR